MTSCLVRMLSCVSLYFLTEESAYKVLNSSETTEVSETSLEGIPLLVEAYGLHKDNAAVVENICTLIMELSTYGM